MTTGNIFGIVRRLTSTGRVDHLNDNRCRLIRRNFVVDYHKLGTQSNLSSADLMLGLSISIRPAILCRTETCPPFDLETLQEGARVTREGFPLGSPWPRQCVSHPLSRVLIPLGRLSLLAQSGGWRARRAEREAKRRNWLEGNAQAANLPPLRRLVCSHQPSRIRDTPSGSAPPIPCHYRRV